MTYHYRNILISNGVIYHDDMRITSSNPEAKIDKMLEPSSNRGFVAVSHT